MTFEEIAEMTEGEELPLAYRNEDNEVVIVAEGSRDGERFFQLTTFQHNDWCRVNIYWEDGTTEELYWK